MPYERGRTQEQFNLMIRLENVLKVSLQDVLKTYWRWLEDVFARRLEDVLRTLWQEVLKISWRRLEDVLKTPSRILEDVLKTSWRRLEDVWQRRLYCSCARRLEEVLKTSSEDVWLRWICSSWLTCLEDVFWRQRRKTSSRRL